MTSDSDAAKVREYVRLLENPHAPSTCTPPLAIAHAEPGSALSMMSGEGRDGLQRIFDRARALSDKPDADVHIVELLGVYVKFESQNGIAWFHFGDALRNVGR